MPTTRDDARTLLRANERALATNAIRPTLRGCALLALAHGLDRKTFLAIAEDCFKETLNEVRRLQPPRWPTKKRRGKRDVYGPRAGRNR